MTSQQIRQSFLDFFQSKQHTIVPSSSLMPDAPNLLFTNAGMNQFVPIFLGQVKCPYTPGRAADTQKCIRAGGKHNDLEDVGLDTYHHTFFEMLGNWSFGDYFKKEAIEWAWELIVGIWKFPPQRLYATVYNPDKAKGDPADFDQEAWDFWAEKFRSVGLDPAVHIVNGNKKDNFWMMGETGPCGPCSELHVDLTPQGDTRGALVNKGSAECIEIWNLVFIQFNAGADGSFLPLPAKHVDTGMGFERVTSIMQGTKGFQDFANAKISNYETDIFRPIFDALEKLSGQRYGSTLPAAGTTGATEQEKVDIAFRVIADHIRTLSFAIADGIQPGNNDRNYVLRRILRRAVRYGRSLGFHEPFFYKLVAVLADNMGEVFPEIRAKQKHVEEVIRTEEEAFNKTLDRGILMFEQRVKVQPEIDEVVKQLHESSFVDLTRQDLSSLPDACEAAKPLVKRICDRVRRVMFGPGFSSDGAFSKLAEVAGDALMPQDVALFRGLARLSITGQKILESSGEPSARLFQDFLAGAPDVLLHIERAFVEARLNIKPGVIPGAFAFQLYDTYGFPLDLTELMARERGLTVDVDGFNKLMEEQKARARAAQKKTVIEMANEDVAMQAPTVFHGFEDLELKAEVLGVDGAVLITIETPFYAEMGGQVGDQGAVTLGGQFCRVLDTKKTAGAVYLHKLDEPLDAKPGDVVTLTVDRSRRAAIQRHHTVTHLLHWALHEVVSRDASQKGSYVGPEKLTFDFNHAPLTPAQIADVEKLVNERILDNAGVSWTEVKYDHIKGRPDVMQFFGDKYGEWVRVVQIGGKATGLDGYSMELCGGTHTRATGEIGLFRIVSETAIAAGVRRIEAIAGLEAWRRAGEELAMLKTVAGRLATPLMDLDKKVENLLAQQKELEREVKLAMLRNASNAASELLGRAHEVNGIPLIAHNLGNADGDFLQAIADSLKGRFKGVVVLGGSANQAVALVATVSPEFTAKVQAGKVIQAIGPIIGGKGGGKPDNARGGGKDVTRLDEALAKVKTLL